MNLETLKEKLKTWINKTPIPSLLSFFINPKAKDPFNPTLAETQATAPDPKNNWVRLGLDKITSFGAPVWLLFVAVAAIVFLRYSTEAIMFFVNFAGQLAALLVFGVIFYIGWKTFTKK